MSDDTVALVLDGSRMEMYTVLMLSSLMSDDTGRAESVMGGSSCCCRMGLMMVMRSVRTSTLVDGRAVGENGEKQGLYRIHSKQMFYVWYT